MIYPRILLSLLLSVFIFSDAFAAPGDWSVYTRNGNIQTMILDGDHLWIGTAGGAFKISNTGAQTKFTTKDGLGGNSIAGLFKSEDSKIWAITKNGILSRNDFLDLPFKIHHRSYLEFKDSVVLGTSLQVGNYAIIPFHKHLCFFYIKEERSQLCLDRVGNDEFIQNNIQKIVWEKNRLFVLTSAHLWSIPVNSFYLDSTRDESGKSVNLADPLEWTLVKNDSFPKNAKSFQIFSQDSAKIFDVYSQVNSSNQVKFIHKPSTWIISAQDTLKEAQFYSGQFGQDQKPTVQQALVNSKGEYFLTINQNLYKYTPQKVLSELKLEGLDMGADPFLGVDIHPNGFPIVNNYKRLLGLKNSKWDTLAQINSGFYDNGSLGDFLRMYYKAFEVNPLGHVFIGTYGTGVLTLRDSTGSGQYKSAMHYNPLSLTKDPNLCIDPTIADGYTVSPSVLYLPQTQVNVIGWMGALAKFHNYGLGVVDKEGKLTCYNNMGTTNIPAGIGLANREGSEFLIPTSSGIDRYQFDLSKKPPFIYQKKYSIENIGEARSFTLDLYNRIWVQGVNALGLICVNGSDEGLCKYVSNSDSVLNVSAAIGIPPGQINDVAVDTAGNIWVATETKGVYKIDPRHGLSAGNRITYFTEEDGLASNLVRDLAIDSKKGQVWFAHENSISSLSISARIVQDSTVKGEGFQLYPNPFKKSEHTKIRMDGLLADAEIVIYTRSFQEVIRFRKSQIVGGYLEWDGRARNGAELAPGMYYIAVQNGKKIQRAKLVILD